MATTSPDRVRRALQRVTQAATADVQKVAAASHSPADIRAALFAATPLIVGDYGDGAAALALDWYEELRDAAKPTKGFTPSPFAVVHEEELASSVAWATQALYDLEQQRNTIADELVAEATRRSLQLLEPVIQKDVASGFRDTVVNNATRDPAAAGWQRFARADGCKFCLMLAGRGAVYTEATADFAAHTDCHCLAGPSYDPHAPKASAIQYVASRRKRTAKERADVRDYLNHHFPDAPG